MEEPTEKQVAYLFRAFPDKTGPYEIKGERFRVYVDVCPELRTPYQENRVTQKFLRAFSRNIRIAIREGLPERKMRVLQTIEDQFESKSLIN